MITTFMRENTQETSFSLLPLVQSLIIFKKNFSGIENFKNISWRVLWIEHAKSLFYFCLKIQNDKLTVNYND